MQTNVYFKPRVKRALNGGGYSGVHTHENETSFDCRLIRLKIAERLRWPRRIVTRRILNEL
jgi:hypothetical protein